MGTMHGPLSPTPDVALKQIACHCNKSVAQTADKNDTCFQLGTAKHNCCEEQIQKHAKTGKPPPLGGERGYTSKGKPIAGTRVGNQMGGTLPKKSVWPDACTVDKNGNPTQFFDFKFRCPKGTRVRKNKKTNKWIKKGGSRKHPGWSEYKDGTSQRDRVVKVGNAQNPKVKKQPKIVDTSNCP